MARKRKCRRQGKAEETANKRCKLSEGKLGNENAVKEYLLSQYYHKVLTLREFLLWRLPSSSKVRRKRVASVGCNGQQSRCVVEGEIGDTTLGRHLDATLIGVLEQDDAEKGRAIKDWSSFSQLANTSKVVDQSGIDEAWVCQSEVSRCPS
jgi:telomerase reverse transcriptase